MSLAITSTETRIGRRTLGFYHSKNIWRGPAEPGPHSAGNVAHRLSGIIPAMTDGIDRGTMVRYQDPTKIIGIAPPQIEIPHLQSRNPDGTASQAATGVAVTQNSPLNSQAIANVAQPTTIPTSVAQMAPAGTPGYLLISSGGGTVANQSPDYFAEAKQWLTEQSLISGVPNWGIALGAALLLGFVWKGGSKR